MQEDKQFRLSKASPPKVKAQTLKLVYKNTRLPQYPGFVTLRFVHATYPNDSSVNFVEMVRTGKRMLREAFDRLVADGTFVPTEQTAALLGKVKPSKLSEIHNSLPHYSVAA